MFEVKWKNRKLSPSDTAWISSENLGSTGHTWVVTDTTCTGIPLCNVVWGITYFYTSVCIASKTHKPNSWCKNIYPGWFVIQFQQPSREAFELLSEWALWGFLCGDDGRNMGKTWDLWLEHVLSRKAVTLLHTLLLSLFASFFSRIQVSLIAGNQNGSIYVWCLILQSHLLWLFRSTLTWHPSLLCCFSLSD